MLLRLKVRKNESLKIQNEQTVEHVCYNVWQLLLALSKYFFIEFFNGLFCSVSFTDSHVILTSHRFCLLLCF